MVGVGVLLCAVGRVIRFARRECLSTCFLQAFVLHALFMALAVAAAVAGSFLLSPSASTTLLAILFPAMFFFGRRLPDYAGNVSGVLKGLVYAVYWVAPHAEFFDMRQRLVHGGSRAACGAVRADGARAHAAGACGGRFLVSVAW